MCQGKFCVLAYLGPSRGLRGAILGPSWANFGTTLGYLGAILGRFWAILGLLYLYSLSCRSQCGFSKTCVSLMRNVCFWNPLTLAVSRGTVGAFLGPSGAIVGYLETTLDYLGPYWAHLGPILGCPGASLAEFQQNLPRQILCNAKFARANFA